MPEEAKELKRARKAKEKARKVFPELADVVGVGLTRRKGVLKLLLRQRTHVHAPVSEPPRSVGGPSGEIDPWLARS